LKGVVLLLSAVGVLALAACGGGNSEATSTGPLALDQRVVTEEDASDSKPDPVEKRVTVSSPDEFISKLGDAFVNPSPEDVAAFKSAGFVQAIDDHAVPTVGHGHLTLAGEPAHPHHGHAVRDGRRGEDRPQDIEHEDSLRPCPENCATSVEEFDVADIPGALGTRRHASQEDIDATGATDVHPYDEYEVVFTDGVFAYRVQLNGPPGSVSEDQAKDIAQSLYDRVHGRPAA
jgi:hypothetical protein